MRIVHARAFIAPNIFAPMPVVRLLIDVGIPVEGVSGGLAGKLFQVLPDLEAEKSFVSALHQGKSLPLDQVIAGSLWNCRELPATM